MTDENAPNDASRRDKAEGERLTHTYEQASGIINRPRDEERASQELVPERSRPGAHRGHSVGQPKRQERER